MNRKQIYNPFLPLNDYVPDGEPHVFGDRVYLYGSHDKEGGETYCLLDYVVYSAPVTDLTEWRCEGTIYRAAQDPDYSENNDHMFAPDVVQGNDGRYYLYYAMSRGFTSPIHVAVCDEPAGKYEYYGCVSNSDGTPFTRYITFDPGVINDEGVIRLYYGWSLAVSARMLPLGMGNIIPEAMREKLLEVQMQMFQRSREEILSEPNGIMGANTVVLADDMITVQTEPNRIVPGQLEAAGTSFEGHAFFEASSIRKINGIYYFIYSSQNFHELCYATSKYPDWDFVFKGTIVSSGDVGIDGRLEDDRLNATGNNHGSIECINGQWYIFYHRPTHKTLYSRQACAEKLTITPQGEIPQVEMTSFGLNGRALVANGEYPAVIACNLTNGHMPNLGEEACKDVIPYITHENDVRYIADIQDGTKIGYKYFSFNGSTQLRLRIKGDGNGKMRVLANEELVSEIDIQPAKEWTSFKTALNIQGERALYFVFEGSGSLAFESFEFTATLTTGAAG